MTREIIICQAHAPYPGNYTCVATNSLGAARQEITVSGKPLAPAWCPAPGEHPAQSTLSGEAVRAEGREARHSLWHCRWRVNSAFPVREHNIYYERVYEDKVLQKYMQTIISST